MEEEVKRKQQVQKKYYDKHKEKFHCECCDVYFHKLSRYNKHCKTKKHDKRESEFIYYETDVFLDLHNLYMINKKKPKQLGKKLNEVYEEQERYKKLQLLKQMKLMFLN